MDRGRDHVTRMARSGKLFALHICRAWRGVQRKQQQLPSPLASQVDLRGAAGPARCPPRHFLFILMTGVLSGQRGSPAGRPAGRKRGRPRSPCAAGAVVGLAGLARCHSVAAVGPDVWGEKQRRPLRVTLRPQPHATPAATHSVTARPHRPHGTPSCHP